MADENELSIPRKGFTSKGDRWIEDFGHQAGVPEDIWGPIALALHMLFEQFALDEHDNYRTIEEWARSGGIGGLGDDVVEETAYGEPSDPGVAQEPSRADHTHGTPPNLVPAHESASDPHPQYIQGEGGGDPLPQYQLRDEGGEPDGYAGLDSGGLVPKSALEVTPAVGGSVWFNRLSEHLSGHRNLTVDYEAPDPESIGDIWVEIVL